MRCLVIIACRLGTTDITNHIGETQFTDSAQQYVERSHTHTHIRLRIIEPTKKKTRGIEDKE